MSCVEQGFTFKSSSSILVVGPSNCGKTTFLKRLLLENEDLLTTPSRRIVYCYGSWQLTFDILKKEGVTFHEEKGGLIPLAAVLPALISGGKSLALSRAAYGAQKALGKIIKKLSSPKVRSYSPFISDVCAKCPKMINHFYVTLPSNDGSIKYYPQNTNHSWKNRLSHRINLEGN
ncbi:unnamed protein product [Pocillopora meandrina]|uniref:Uncharacterized protein n=1 Tax=Pocillopora meandrina TaxID=46732 RepID=A0AAU9WSF0_9CNID|nr:unnamed protein product [Pocillopora meandrina]